MSLAPFKQQEARERVYPLLGGAPETVEPRCGHFDTCGGCQVQHLPYPVQLAFKRESVCRAFHEVGLEVRELVGEVAGMEDPWHYRNKADFNVRPMGGAARLGFTLAGAKGIVEVRECPISSPEINQVLQVLRRLVPARAELKRKLHSIVVRSSRLEGRAAVLYHTRLKEPGVFESLTRQLMEECPVVKGAAHVVRGRSVTVGETALTERIAGIDYTYSLGSFFQANPGQTRVLVESVLAQAEPTPQDVVADVYSGVGLFSLQLARRAREVYAIEDTPAAVADARANATMAGLENCKFLRGQAHDQLDTLERLRLRISLFVVDPPRSGCSKEALELAVRTRPRRLVYVSCNPRSLARDAGVLAASGYRLGALQAIDMFPQTLHVECVARFDGP